MECVYIEYCYFNLSKRSKCFFYCFIFLLHNNSGGKFYTFYSIYFYLFFLHKKHIKSLFQTHPALCASSHQSVDHKLPDRQEATVEVGETSSTWTIPTSGGLSVKLQKLIINDSAYIREVGPLVWSEQQRQLRKLNPCQVLLIQLYSAIIQSVLCKSSQSGLDQPLNRTGRDYNKQSGL